jgi:Helix-turn-helix domain
MSPYTPTRGFDSSKCRKSLTIYNHSSYTITMTNATLPTKTGFQGDVQGWIQSDKRAHLRMSKFGLKNPAALPVLHFLISRLNKGTNSIFISQQSIASLLDIDKKTVARSIAALASSNYLRIIKLGNSNCYEVNSQVCWQGNRGARHQFFNAEMKESVTKTNSNNTQKTTSSKQSHLSSQ